MKNFKLLLLGLPLVIACGDKEIEDDTTTSDTNTDTNDTDTDNTDTGDTSEPSAEPLEPVAIGFEYSGIWDEENAALHPYLFPDLNNTNEGNPLALGNWVTVTLASIEYFSLGSEATDEERDYETCTFLTQFAYQEANLLADNFDWNTGVGGTGTYDSVNAFQSFEGTLYVYADSASPRCAELSEGYDIGMFDQMRFGMIFGGLSDYMTGEFEGTDWWADDVDAQNAYFTQYIAVNHPADNSAGYDFIGYDWTSSIFVEADPTVCQDIETGEMVDGGTPSDTVVCGMVQTEEGPNGAQYLFGNVNENIGTRYGYVQGNAWWYEDFPNLDLSLLGEYPAE